MAEILEPDETQILAAMLGISEMIGNLSDIQELLGTVVRIVPQLVRSNRCAVFVLDKKSQELKCAQAFCPDIEQTKYLMSLTIKESEIPKLSQKVLKQHLPAFIRDASREEILPAIMVQTLGLKMLLIVPLVCRDEVMGIMMLDDTRVNRYFTSKEINIVTGIATMAAIAVEWNTTRDNLLLEKGRLEAVASTLSDAFLVLDTRLRILYINEPGQKLLGWTAEEIVGKPCSEIFKAIDANGVQVCGSICPGRHILWGEDVSKQVYRLNFQKKDGSRIPCEIRGSAVRDSQGQIKEIVYALISSSKLPKHGQDPEAQHLEDLEEIVVENR